MKTSINALRIGAYFEGREYKAYRDPLSKDGLPITIGIGHTGPEVHLGLVWDDDQIDTAFEIDIAQFERIANDSIKVTVNQNQFDAFVSALFNIGPGRVDRPGNRGKDGLITLRNGQPSTLLRKLNAGDFAGAQAEFVKWCHAGDGKSLGLYRRRYAERLVFGGESAEFAINAAARINNLPE